MHLNTILAIDPGMKNMGVAEIDGKSGEILQWCVVDLVQTVKKPSVARLVTAACKYVSQLNLARIGTVRIEQQPNQNVKMKCLSHALQAIFISLCPMDTVVEIVNAKAYKLAGGTYAARKKDSILKAHALVDDYDPNNVWGSMFRGHKKKDDLADALLLALYQCEFQPIASTWINNDTQILIDKLREIRCKVRLRRGRPRAN
jgi:Holliday junction resolvasome RuvABC endonuclease subunit